MKIEIYSDVACPWCYVGERRLARALAALPGGDQAEVRFRPFQLDPAAPATAEPMPRHLQRKFGQLAPAMLARVEAAGAEEGVVFDWERAQAVNTRNAHRLLAFAERRHGAAVQRDVAERLFALHFAQGGDVGDADQLAAVAAEAGMHAEEVREHLRSTAGERELADALEGARRIGIRAVPTFVVDGRWAVEGAQPVAALVEVLEHAARSGEPAAR